MKRLQVLLVFVAVSVVFLLLQFYLIRHVSKPGTLLHHASWESVQYSERSTVSFENTQSFLSVCQTHKKPVFLIDPAVLQLVINSSTPTGRPACKHLCVDQPTTAFGIISTLWSRQDEFIKAMRRESFTVQYYTETDPRYLNITFPESASRAVPTHHLFHRRGHSIHLVILYERRDSYWWHGRILHNSNVHGDLGKVPIRQQDLSFGLHAGAFDKMELAKVTMDGLQLRAPRFPAMFLNQLPHSRFIECNYTQAQHFYSVYGEDKGREALQFKRAAEQILVTAKRTLDSLGARFWLSSGTCLGWFRQCDIIPHSKDVDFGMWIQDYQAKMQGALRLNGLSVKHVFGKMSDSYELSFSAGDVKLDIFFFYEEENYMWNGGTQAGTGQKFKYTFPKFTLCWTEFLGLRVRVPCDTLTYIEANYGDTWFQPVKEWDWKSSPPNVLENGQWAESERSEVIKTYELDYD